MTNDHAPIKSISIISSQSKVYHWIWLYIFIPIICSMWNCLFKFSHKFSQNSLHALFSVYIIYMYLFSIADIKWGKILPTKSHTDTLWIQQRDYTENRFSTQALTVHFTLETKSIWFFGNIKYLDIVFNMVKCRFAWICRRNNFSIYLYRYKSSSFFVFLCC